MLLFESAIVPEARANTISLDEFLTSIQQRHPLIIWENLTPEIERANRERYLADQDWRLDARQSLYTVKPVTTSSFQPSRITEVKLDASLGRTLWSTGGAFSMAWSSARTDQTLPGLTFPSESGPVAISTGASRLYEHRLSLTYSQPLLRDFGGRLDRLEYDLSTYNVTVAELEAVENQEDFLRDLGLQYLDWVFLQEQVLIAERRLQLAEEQLEQTTEKHEANLIDKVDVLRAEDAVRTARQNMVLLRSRFDARRAELAVLAQDTGINEMIPAYDIYALADLPSVEESSAQIAAGSRRLQVLAQRRDQFRERRSGFAETGRPSLNLDLGVGLTGGDNGFGNSLEMTKPDFSVAFAFTQAIGANAAESDVARSDIEIRRLEAQMDLTTLNLQSILTGLLIQLYELERVLELNQEEIESAARRTEEEVKLYEQGRGELTFVIQSRDNEQNARLTYAGNAIAYHKLLLQYRALTDQLLTRQK
ncbi:MAG: TolC family protein [candidate division Zixibacteria bacterium]|nr:TolC family protein [candidate division Zixibacteria bacterium]